MASRLLARARREPLVLFLVLGLAIFAVDRWRGGAGPDDLVVVSQGELERLRALWRGQAQRDPTPAEMRALVDDWVREEVLYREALRLGLDDGDIIVRRRLVQKMEFFVQEAAQSETPTDDELRAWFEEHRDRYRRPETLSLRHVFWTRASRSSEEAQARAEAALASLRAGAGADGAWRSLGDPFMLNREYADRELREIGEVFGREFAERVVGLEPGRWSGPVPSVHGLHLVQVVARRPGGDLSFEEARAAVLADVGEQRRRRAVDHQYEELLGRYRVEIEGSEAEQGPADTGSDAVKAIESEEAP